MKILVADDDRVSLMMMRRMLLQSGYEVVTATDGQSALDGVLQDDGPRLLLLDWMMPTLNGPEVCRAIRANSRQRYVYIVLLTAKSEKDDLIAGLEAGADDFLTKPCHPEELTARLRTGQRILLLEDGLVEARNEMQFRATHDSLTHILNRGAVVQRVTTHLAESAHTGESAAIFLCDADHFKSINDTFGHPVGDEVLKEIAKRLESFTMESDAVGRFGGEEFLVLLRDIDPERMSALGRNICEVMYSKPVQTSAGPIPVSLSVGALCLSSGSHKEITDVLRRADLLLYQAKREGRNRSVSSVFEVGANRVHPEQLESWFPPALMLTS